MQRHDMIDTMRGRPSWKTVPDTERSCRSVVTVTVMTLS